MQLFSCACEAWVGRSLNTGDMSLSGALLLGGADAIVMNLRKVDDKAIINLAKEFIDCLVGKPRRSFSTVYLQ